MIYDYISKSNEAIFEIITFLKKDFACQHNFKKNEIHHLKFIKRFDPTLCTECQSPPGHNSKKIKKRKILGEKPWIHIDF